MNRTRALLSVVSLLAFGCSDDGEGTGTQSTDDSSTTATDSATATATETATNTATNTASDPSTGPDPTTGSSGPDPDTSSDTGSESDSSSSSSSSGSEGESESESESESSGTTGSAACDAMGDPCGECILETCCPEYQTCLDDADCACVFDCLFGGQGDPMTCTVNTCGLNALPPALEEVYTCTAGAPCGAVCQ